VGLLEEGKVSDIVDLLSKIELFSGLSRDKIQQIVTVGHPETFNAGETIFAEGEPSDELYVIQSGMVEVVITGGMIPDVPGQQTPVVQLGRGQVFGEMALVDQGMRSATIRCVQDGAALFVIPREAFWTLCDADYHIGYVVMRNIARDLSFKLRHRNLRLELGDAGGAR
jgi:CRP-like cAMP-binding protein